ncbi:UDP-N-acetylmuramate dehydrogenase [Pseudoalteromonas spongiae]|uniref:UDP-N-acetylmuramate dehydrogenase n=1 Tax=Pseudoalteromonas spongiae TaxID=298657 RepID=UPI00026CA9E6|nr:UDP-N-acetylmuramate dehydrogenase [Pseudoalteromonas spongiae]ATC97385.1 UDP-N-acetylmuramate dehydrogenase [Pseudoalteromonas spongiae UST010723-006]
MISLSQLHTFALPAYAKRLIRIEDPTELQTIDWQAPFIVLGEGSNTVFVDDYQGVIIQIANKGIEISESTDAYILNVAAGENWHQLVTECTEQGVYGFENLALIPGTVGAAPVQNIGAYGVEVKDLITSVSGYNIELGEYQTLTAAECQFAYRDSIFKHALLGKFVITSVEFTLTKAWQPQLTYGPLQELNTPNALQVMKAVIAIRSSKLPDPAVEANSGSFFKNPIVPNTLIESLHTQYENMPTYPVCTNTTKLAAGWLIEKAGLKGFKMGGVQVSNKQALVLINTGTATRDDLLAMVAHIQNKVFSQFGVVLEHEVRLVAKTGETKVEVATCRK